MLWNITYIKVTNKFIYYKNWQVRNIYLIQDILSKDSKILTKGELNDKYGINPSPLHYESLVSAVPSKWKKMIANEYTEIDDYQYPNRFSEY